MLVALLTDIHGNREALDACLEHARRIGAARFVFLGDYVGYGADPSYVVDTVSGMVEEGAVALLGNHDEAIASPSENMNALARAAIDWTRGRLDAAQGAFLRTLPLFRQEGERLFVHASAHHGLTSPVVCRPSAAWRAPIAVSRSAATCTCRPCFI